jgi:hypothetical protein
MSNVAIAAPDPTKARDFSRFSCRRFDTGGTVRVAAAGELDMATVPELDLTLRHAQADARVVALDLRELEFPVLRRATRPELSYDISLRSAGRVCRLASSDRAFPPGDPPPSSPSSAAGRPLPRREPSPINLQRVIRYVHPSRREYPHQPAAGP